MGKREQIAKEELNVDIRNGISKKLKWMTKLNYNLLDHKGKK